ncbi:MAG: glycosyl hydrolase family 2, partial [Duncaniella sp.]|nr:glycosyl hydrolase family 2 [Duncaniella sp.]
MKLSRKILTAILLAGGTTFAFCQPSPTDWYPETTVNRPFVRWWWHGSAVDPEGLTFNLSEMAEKGIGGVEITPIYGVMGNEANDLPYLSDKWMDALAHTTSEARRLGMQVDMNNGTGWPFGGPEVTLSEAAKKYIVETFTTGSKRKISEKIRPKDHPQIGVATLQTLLAVSPDGKRRFNITDHLRPDSTLDWKAPKGEPWTVYALFCGPTFQKVKRAAPGGEGYVINHYDSVAVKNYLSRFDRSFKGREHLVPTSFFNDSYEVYGASWTENFLDEFSADHGYRLENFLPEFVSEDHNSTRRRLIHDYRSTLGRLLKENFTDVWTRWAHSHGATVRNQSHGSPANIIDIYAAVDIPECESFGKTDFNIPGIHSTGPSRPSDAAPAVLKFASSAAHLAGRPVTSAETLTWLTYHFNTSLARCKPEIDQMFCSGVNHVVFHGAPYSPAHAEFPGWLFYASINVSPTNSFWQDSPGLFKYISRIQAALSAGTPDNDFLLYFPFDDVITRQGGNPYMMFEIHKMDARMPDVKAAVAEVIQSGYDVDYLSDELLGTLALDNRGRLLSKGSNRYNAIIVPEMTVIQPGTLAELLQKAMAGASVIFIGELPTEVPGMTDMSGRQDLLEQIKSMVPAQQGVTEYGKGKVIRASSISDALALTGVKGEQLRRDGLHMIRRANEAGGHNYFVALLRETPLDGWVNLAVSSGSAMFFDPLTGESGKAMTKKAEDGTTDILLSLKP